MKRALQGRYVKVATAGEAFKAFVPKPLPPRPAIDWTLALHGRFDTALLALGRLDAVTDLLPNTALLLYSFVRKEGSAVVNDRRHAVFARGPDVIRTR